MRGRHGEMIVGVFVRLTLVDIVATNDRANQEWRQEEEMFVLKQASQEGC